MTKFVPFAILATVAAIAAAPATAFAAETSQPVQAVTESVSGSAVSVSAGKMLYGPDGRRIASVYRVAANGDVQLILDGRLYTVAASSLSETGGKVATSLTKKEIRNR